MNSRLLLHCGVLWLASVPSPGLGQDVPDGPAVASHYLNALAEEHWIEAAELVHPETAEFLRDASLARYECPPEVPRPTFEEYRAMQPGLPRFRPPSCPGGNQ